MDETTNPLNSTQRDPAPFPGRVLVGCGDIAVLQGAVRALTDAGITAQGVSSLDDLIALADGGAWDIIAFDGRWADAAVEKFASLRERAPDALWIVVGHEDTLHSVIAPLQFDVAEVLLEPCTPQILLEAINRVTARAQRRLEMARLSALVPLYEVSQAFMSELHLDDVLHKIVEVGVEATGARRGSLMLLDEDRQELTIKAAVGIPPEVIRTARERVGRGIAGWVARTGTPLVINDASDIPPFLREALRGGMASSAVCLPLKVKGKVIGVINLTKSADQPPFSPGDAELLSVLAGQAAIAIENARLFEEVQAAYEDLRRLDEMKSEFVNVAAHELRTPVAVILGYAALLAEELPPDSPMAAYLTAMLRNAQRLQNVADELLDLDRLSRMQPQQTGDDLVPVDVARVIQEVVAHYRPLADERQIALSVDVPDISAWALGDESQLALILRHLLSNAIKHTPNAGRITVTVEGLDDEVVIAVADTGPGIPPERRRHLFEPFYQAEPVLTRTHSGLGVGLSIARRLAELQGGRLWLDDRPGFGAVFCVALTRAVRGDGTAPA
ncbi:MAG: hypothetical protein Kow0047_06320 [Anaerolineae bacterium]